MKNHMLVIVMPEEAGKPMNTENGKVMVPLYNIPMMSDDRWSVLFSFRKSFRKLHKSA